MQIHSHVGAPWCGDKLNAQQFTKRMPFSYFVKASQNLFAQVCLYATTAFNSVAEQRNSKLSHQSHIKMISQVDTSISSSADNTCFKNIAFNSFVQTHLLSPNTPPLCIMFHMCNTNFTSSGVFLINGLTSGTYCGQFLHGESGKQSTKHLQGNHS